VITAMRVLAAIALAVCATWVHAQTYPAKPVRLLVGAPPGGTTDTLARSVGQETGRLLGQPVVVENRAGAGGNIAADAVAKSAPDGHTLLMSFTSHTINPSLYDKLPFDTVKDFAPITMVATVPSVLLAHPSLPAATLADLLGYAKANPGRLTFGVGALGSSVHLAGELFKTMAGVDIVNVPYKGTSPAMTDLLGGQISLMFASAVTGAPQVKAGRLKAYGVTSAKRLALFPEVPAIAEAVPGYESYAWFGVFAPAKTSADIVSKLQQTIAAALKTPALNARLEAEAALPVGSTPDQFAAFVVADIAKWAKIVKSSGAKVQ
jgi:tripartite-type tricarboxylate transporter receptor subunit TctC